MWPSEDLTPICVQDAWAATLTFLSGGQVLDLSQQLQGKGPESDGVRQDVDPAQRSF